MGGVYILGPIKCDAMLDRSEWLLALKLALPMMLTSDAVAKSFSLRPARRHTSLRALRMLARRLELRRTAQVPCHWGANLASTPGRRRGRRRGAQRLGPAALSHHRGLQHYYLPSNSSRSGLVADSTLYLASRVSERSHL